jgi:ureidoacrylate peracid hydrolase
MRWIGALIALLALGIATATAQALSTAQVTPGPRDIVLKTMEQQIDPKITALLVIDMQNDYVSDNGKMAKIPGFNVKVIQAAVPAMNNLIEEARKAGVLVVWVRQTHLFKDSLPNYLASSVNANRVKDFKETDFIVQGDTSGADYYDKMVKRLPSEIEVIKHTYDGFTNTPLDTYLRAHGIKTIMSIGTVTNVCVGSTASHGWFLGYYSLLPTDAVASNDPTAQAAYLKNHSIFFGYTPTNEQIVSVWKKYASH